MEHLLNGGHGPRLRVPFFGYLYDGNNFLEYPRSQGWDIDWIAGAKDTDNRKRIPNANAFLQAWLFFGLLENIMGMKTSVDDFVCREDHSTEYITTARLSDYFERWKRRDYTSKDSDKQAILRTTTPYLRAANSLVLGFHRQPNSVNGVSPELLLSLQLIGSALTQARSVLYLGATRKPEEINSFYLIWGDSSLMKSHMLKSGWCRSIVTAFASKSLDVQCFASSLKPPPVQKDHNHCSRRTCLANQVLEDTYEVKHVSESCQCQRITLNIQYLVSIIRKGQTPLIKLPTPAESRSSKYILELVEHRPDTPYIAISHVWKDGLGNPHQNALPACQIARLASSIRRLPAARRNTEGGMSGFLRDEDPSSSTESLLIWMDTLCIPVGHDHKRERVVAIQSMRRIYQEADSVCVMDADIQQSSVNAMHFRRPPVDRTELMFRFSMCGWNSRLWTFEEGILAKDAYFLLRDGIISAKDLFYRTCVEIRMEDNITNEAIGMLRPIVVKEIGVAREEISLGRIILGLRFRQTSRGGDETLCLSHMLETDTEVLLNENEPESRMQVFLSTLKHIPPGLLFMGEPRLSAEGYRWAPTSFLHRQDKCYDSQKLIILPRHPFPDRPAAEIMSDGSGLKIMTPGIRLGLFNELPSTAEFTIKFSGSKQKPFLARYDRDPSLESQPWESVRERYLHRIAALILPCYPVDYHNPIDCVLVALQEDAFADDFIHANIVCSFQVFDTQNFQAVTFGSWIPYPQTWIVD